MQVVCDECKKEFEINQQVERVKGDIRRVYFICPHCKFKYISYYLNSKIEQKQEKIRKIANKLSKYVKGTPNGDKYWKLYEGLKKEIKKDMDILKERFERNSYA